MGSDVGRLFEDPDFILSVLETVPSMHVPDGYSTYCMDPQSYVYRHAILHCLELAGVVNIPTDARELLKSFEGRLIGFVDEINSTEGRWNF